MTQQERRQYSRKTPNPLPYINLPSGNGGIILDVSEQGLRFRALAPLEHSGPIDFSFTAQSNLVCGTGELVWIDPVKKMGGLRFTDLPYNALERIRKLPCNSDLQPGFGEDLSMHIPAVGDFQSSATNRRGARAALTSKVNFWLNRVSAASSRWKTGVSWPSALPNTLAKIRALSPAAFSQKNNRRLVKASSAVFLGIAILALVLVGHRQAGALLIRMGTKLSGQATIQAPAPAVAPQTTRVDEIPAYQAKTVDPVAQTIPPALSAATEKTGKEISAAPPAPQAEEPAARLPKPEAPRGELVVQVAALTQEADARELSDKLRQENFQAFVGTLPADSFYRVMLGPYADAASALTVRGKLKKAGFNSFIRRETTAERLGSVEKAAPRQEPAT